MMGSGSAGNMSPMTGMQNMMPGGPSGGGMPPNSGAGGPTDPMGAMGRMGGMMGGNMMQGGGYGMPGMSGKSRY